MAYFWLLIPGALLLFVLFIIWASSPAETERDAIYSSTSNRSNSLPRYDGSLHLMTYNIGFGNGVLDKFKIKTNRDAVLSNLSEIVSVINTAKPDILLVQEIDRDSDRSFGIDQVQYILDHTHFSDFSYSQTWSKKWIPFPYSLNPKNHFGKVDAGQAVFSVFPIQSEERLVFDKPESNSWIYNLFYLDRILQIVDIQVSETETLKVGNVHLEAFNKETREKQAKRIRSLHDQYEFDVLGGDFNAIHPNSAQNKGSIDEPELVYADDKTLSHLESGKLLVSDLSLLDVRDYTFPSDAPSRRLDYFFSNPLKYSLQSPHIFSEANGSDHLPYSINLRAVELDSDFF